MRRHAKAATAGSTQRQATGLGRFFRGADTTRGASGASRGSGAPSARRFALPLSAFAAILAAVIFVVALASAAAPPAITEPATNVEETTATLNGSVNPSGALLEECKFEYGTTTGYGQTKACDLTPAEIGEGTGNVAVKADLTGLSQVTTYHFRLVAKNADGTGNGFDGTFTTLGVGPPDLDGWAQSVARTEATLRARINPNGLATTYKVEWGPTAAYGNSTADSNVGSDKADHTVSRVLTGLTPGATYHYRFVATNSADATQGPDHTFTTYALVSPDTSCPNQIFRIGPGAQLRDCRAYEMVSPVDKSNGDIVWYEGPEVNAALNQASLSGDKVTYSSYKTFGDGVSAPFSSQYISSRGSEGWTTHNISPPSRGGKVTSLGFIDNEYKAFSPDLSIGWVIPESAIALAPGGAPEHANFYKHDIAADTYETLTVGGSELPPQVNRRIDFEGASSDNSHVIFNLQDSLNSEAPGVGQKLYEWFDGQVRLVSILPNGEPLTMHGAAAGSEGSGFGGNRFGWKFNAISEDGSRIFWSANEADYKGTIYVRIDGDTTVDVSGSVGTAPSRFWGASADGSKVVFGSSTGGTVSSEKEDLYEFDVDTETPTLIAHEGIGVVGISEDASYVYFVSEADLAAGATPGGRNLYLRHEGATSFITTLSVADASSGNHIFSTGAVAPSSDRHYARVTPDGRHVVFMSDRSLTGYDNTYTPLGKPVDEVYRYDADTEALNCVSCNPSGSRPALALGYPLRVYTRSVNLQVAAWIPGWQFVQSAARPLVDDGTRVFFNSFDALVTQDTNGAQDVYEWTEPGSGSCSEGSASFSALNGGCVSLISSGESRQESEFIDASTTGRDVFIRTQSSLAEQDPGWIDVYDARIGGGFPTPVQPVPCSGDTCQSPAEAPNDQTPASAAFRGAGDPAPRKARRRACRGRKQGSVRQAKHKSQAKHKKKGAAACRGANGRTKR